MMGEQCLKSRLSYFKTESDGSCAFAMTERTDCSFPNELYVASQQHFNKGAQYTYSY